MTNQDANTIEKKIKQLACDIAEKIESMLNGDFIDVYFYICDYDTLEVDYSFQRDSGTIMTVTAQSQEFFASECDGYVEPAGIEQELEMNANQHIC